MSQTPAGWFPDPDDASQYRYWDGTAWTEHRAPRTTTTDQLSKAGDDLADGLAKGFTAVGNWVKQNASSPASQQPTFASVAASCRDEPARQPLSNTVEAVVAPHELLAIQQLFTSAGTTVTPAGATLDNEVCRLVPNPWNPQDPTGVAVFVGARQVGRLPPDAAGSYSAPLTQLTQKQLLATGVASIWAQGDGIASTARVTLQLPEPSAFA